MDLVMGTASGYSPSVVDRFCTSLRRVNKTCDIVLFIEDSDLKNYSDLMKKHNVNFVIFCKPSYHLHAYRFKLYADYLLDKKDVGYVFICDVRDLIFNKDPFAIPNLRRYHIHFILEDRIIGESAFNSNWIRYAFGEENLQKIATQPISCAGTTMANLDGMKFYLSCMNDIAKNLLENDGQIFPCLDQGFHNFLVHGANVCSGFRKFWKNSENFVFTMGYSEHKFLENGVPSINDIEPCVVHQFDRMNFDELYKFGNDMDMDISDLIVNRELLKKEIQVRIEIRDINQQQLILIESHTFAVDFNEETLGSELFCLVRGFYKGDRIKYETLVIPPFIRQHVESITMSVDPADGPVYDVYRYSDNFFDLLVLRPENKDDRPLKLVPATGTGTYAVSIQFS